MTILDAGIQMQRALRERLTRLAARLYALEEVSTDDLIGTIEEITMIEKYYTPEQLEQLEQRKQAVGPERMNEVQSDWSEVFEGFRLAMERNADPASEQVQKLVRRSDALIREFTGGDSGIEQSLHNMNRENPQATRQRKGLAPDVAEFMSLARASANGPDSDGER